MKKKPSERIKSLMSFMLYRNDIEELLELLNGYGFDVQLSDKKYEYTNLEEIKDTQGDVVRDLTITGTGNGSCRVQLKFSRVGSILEVSNHDETFLQMEDLLRPRRRILLTLISGAVAIPSVLGFAVAMTSNHLPLAVVFFVLCVSTGLLCMSASGGALSVVYLTPKHQAPSFWKRNKDALWIIVLTAIVTALVSVATSYFLFKQGVK